MIRVSKVFKIWKGSRCQWERRIRTQTAVLPTIPNTLLGVECVWVLTFMSACATVPRKIDLAFRKRKRDERCLNRLRKHLIHSRICEQESGILKGVCRWWRWFLNERTVARTTASHCPATLMPRIPLMILRTILRPPPLPIFNATKRLFVLNSHPKIHVSPMFSLLTNKVYTPPHTINPLFQLQVRFAARDTEYQPSQRRRKRKHGFLARKRSWGGHKILVRRMTKSRKFTLTRYSSHPYLKTRVYIKLHSSPRRQINKESRGHLRGNLVCIEPWEKYPKIDI